MIERNNIHSSFSDNLHRKQSLFMDDVNVCIVSLASSLAATACTNMTRTANVFTHNKIY